MDSSHMQKELWVVSGTEIKGKKQNTLAFARTRNSNREEGRRYTILRNNKKKRKKNGKTK